MDAVNEGGAEARIGSARNERVEEVKSTLSQQLERFERIISWKLNSEAYDEACVWRDTLPALVHVMLRAGVRAQPIKNCAFIARNGQTASARISCCTCFLELAKFASDSLCGHAFKHRVPGNFSNP